MKHVQYQFREAEVADSFDDDIFSDDDQSLQVDAVPHSYMRLEEQKEGDDLAFIS